ncbi:MAG: T9SS type A sorting domain-containing protein [Ignavibacteria bacterium]|nr:T9SS type A sorting domain-containing protein [Ignavibacteria bacterium]
MLRLIFVLLLFFFTNQNCLFLQETLRFRMKVIGNDTLVFDKLVLGFHKNATNGLDTGLGELDLPPFLPPSGYKIYGFLVFYDSSREGNVLSYLDLRPFPTDVKDTIKFNMWVFRESGIRLSLSWPILKEEFVYARITEPYILDVDMRQTNFAVISNEFVTHFRFEIKILLRLNLNVDNQSDELIPSVNYLSEEKYLYIYNPNSSELHLQIFDSLGNLVFEEFLRENLSFISFPALSKGLYFYVINLKDGSRVIDKLLIF